MNYADKLLIVIFLLAIIVRQALHQAELFKKNITISHFWKGMVYAGSVALMTIPCIHEFGWWYLLKIPILGVLERAALFYLFLNKARNEKWYYIGTGEKGSWFDRLENKLPLKVLMAVKIGYMVLFITALIFIK